MSNRENKPTIGALVFALRHPELWPPGFEWNFNVCETCAIGLAHRMWPKQIQSPSLVDVRGALGIDPINAREIFGNGHYNFLAVTPAMVADKLDAIA